MRPPPTRSTSSSTSSATASARWAAAPITRKASQLSSPSGPPTSPDAEAMPYDKILLAKKDGLASLTFNAPERLNAVSRKMIAEIKSCWEDLAADSSVRAVLLTGSGRGFCAGADLADPDREAGVGMSFVLASDIAIAGQSASFLQAFARIGLLPDGGSTWFLPRLVGEQRARALAMLAPQIPAEEAKEWGLIWDVVEDGELMKTATELARQLADGPTMSLARIKEAMNRASGNDLGRQLDLERDFQRELGRSEDFKEGVAAFLAKRKPAFKGK